MWTVYKNKIQSFCYKKGQYWIIGLEGQEAHVKGIMGLDIISLLLRYPYTPIHVITLYHYAKSKFLDFPELEDQAHIAANLDDLNFLPKRPHERLREWNEEIRNRIETLKEEFQKFSAAGKTVEAMMVRDEIKELKADLSHKISVKTQADENIRTNVQKHIKKGVKKIHAELPYLKTYLKRSTLITGWECVYNPEIDRPIEWILDPPRPAH